MKISSDLLTYIQNALSAATYVGINSLIIEPGMVRGLHDDRTVALIQDRGVPTLPFSGIGLTRLTLLQARLNLMSEMDGFCIDTVTKDNVPYVFSLAMRAKSTKVDYRCADPNRIIAKKVIQDPLVHRVKFNTETVTMLQRAMGAVASEKVAIICNSEGVSFELADDNNDVFKHVFADSAETISGVVTDAHFAYRYPTKLLFSVLKKEPEAYVEFGQQGLLRISLQGFGVYLVPRA